MSPLASLAGWLCEHPGSLRSAPWDLVAQARIDVVDRLSRVAVREPTRRHRKHFDWLLSWYARLTDVLVTS